MDCTGVDQTAEMVLRPRARSRPTPCKVRVNELLAERPEALRRND